MYPPEFRISQRIMLMVDKKEFDFIGYLAMRQSKAFRAVAFGALGGKIFDFLFENGNHRVLRNPDGMPLRPLHDGVMKDIRHLYDSRFSNRASLIKQIGNCVTVRSRLNDRDFELYVFSMDTGLLQKSMVMSDDITISDAVYSDYREYRGIKGSLPSRIVMTNHRWHYQMKIALLKIEPGGVPDKILTPCFGRYE
jgi:hypothetical protein